MPSSDPSNIALVLRVAMRQKPSSVLDVGIGCGKYGLLFREYLDGHRQGVAFHDPKTRKMRLDGVEIFAGYITPAHRYIYDEIIQGDIRAVAPLRMYDLIFLGDVIEHMEKADGKKLLRELTDKLTLCGLILISTPDFESAWNKALPFGNEHERHLCRWNEADFMALAADSAGRLTHETYGPSSPLLTVGLRRVS